MLRSMASTITISNMVLLKRLRRSGRFKSYGEIVRYGLELVRREIEREDLSPIPDSALEAAYAELSKEDHELDKKLGRASAKPMPGELDLISGKRGNGSSRTASIRASSSRLRSASQTPRLTRLLKSCSTPKMAWTGKLS